MNRRTWAILALFLFLVPVLCVLAHWCIVAMERQKRATALYQGVGVALHRYAEKNDGALPPIDASRRRVCLAVGAIAPKYINSEEYWRKVPTVPYSKGSPAIHEGSAERSSKAEELYYYYCGYAILSDDEAETLCRVLSEDFASKMDANSNIMVGRGKGNLGGDLIYRLKLGTGKTLSTSEVESARIESRIPVMIPRSASPYWGNRKMLVLYLDNHVEEVKYPGEFPVSERTQAAFRALEGKWGKLARTADRE